MSDYADLEITLLRRDSVTYVIQPRFARPKSDTDVRLDADGPLVAHIDPDALQDLDDDEYGRALGECLFGGGFGTAFRMAVATSQSEGVRLRVRLVMDSSAAALHELRWETIRDPRDGSTLTTSENVLFSRYLGSLDWRSVTLGPRESLSALVVVAAPSGQLRLTDGRVLEPFDAEDELRRARDGLVGYRIDALPSATGRPTIDQIVDKLRSGYDVLYLVCHGYLHHEEPVLVLEGEDGQPRTILGSELADRIRELTRLPRLVYLASCQTAGAGDERHSEDAGVLCALGPRLAASGVPAVIAMQGNITMTTAGEFATAFFRALNDDGLVDRATAVARGAVRGRPDWWAPTLFMRLKSGRLWYASGSAGGDAGPDIWPDLITMIKAGFCTPIIGPAISDALLGTRQEIARAWATRYRYPMAPHNRESLPQVAQWLSVAHSRPLLGLELDSQLRGALHTRFEGELPPEALEPTAPIEDVLAAGWTALHARGAVEPYSVLADLPLPIYLTTQPSRLLANALEAVGREPEVVLCRWNEETDWPESVFDREPGYKPTVQRPLVYHLLGLLELPSSLVLTEDDYFDFLTGVTRDREVVPKSVRAALSASALMFVGFRIDEWDFRVLFSGLMKTEGANLRKGFSHVAVQIDPEEGSTIDAARARAYLERYMLKTDISLYWGSSDAFLKELHGWVAR
ncbi:CHAT domain-containing protein [Cellulomonas humilata]|uniref:CHAT domain-containing protein n=1 Tax=Cellulomonas humilata TaxID=144055 RepID=A0ABU0EFA4_9CELL|nr:CHAT domain-containing protein [Cellulomonas humilata]MDQ0373954.1 hypothetical protein [Cellulomonas humilata]